jgi:hypothetical protein
MMLLLPSNLPPTFATYIWRNDVDAEPEESQQPSIVFFFVFFFQSGFEYNFIITGNSLAIYEILTNRPTLNLE